MTSKINLVSLQFKTTEDFNQNLQHLINLIEQIPKNSFIVAPELCLYGFAYDRFEEAIDTTIEAIDILKRLSINQTISLTLLTKKENNYFNTLHIFHKGKIIYTQSKIKLFELGNEQKYFKSDKLENIRIIDIDGLKIGFMICFEIRFIEFWEKLKGSDIIVIPAMWGKPRKSQFENITKTIAIINQCFIVASNSSNEDMASSSAIVSPFGDVYIDDTKEILSIEVNLSEIKKMRRYLKIGLE